MKKKINNLKINKSCSRLSLNTDSRCEIRLKSSDAQSRSHEDAGGSHGIIWRFLRVWIKDGIGLHSVDLSNIIKGFSSYFYYSKIKLMIFCYSFCFQGSDQACLLLTCAQILNMISWPPFAGSRTTPADTPAPSRRPTACVRAACWARPGRRASSTAAPRSTLPLSSWRGLDPVLEDDTPTLRSTSPWPWGAPVCPWWRRNEAVRGATRACRGETLKPDRCSLQAGKHEGDTSQGLKLDKMRFNKAKLKRELKQFWSEVEILFGPS